MTDIKTTVTGFLTALFAILAYFNVVVPQALAVTIMAICVALFGYFSKDKSASPSG